MARRKVTRSVTPNVGTQKALAREMNKLRRQARRMIIDDILNELSRTGILAYDASIGTVVRNAAKALEALGGFISRKLGEWLKWLTDKGEAMARRFVRRITRDSAAGVKSAFRSVGVTEGYLKTRLTIKIGNQYISPSTAAKLPDFVKEMVGLITKTTAQDVDKIQGAIAEGLAKGQNIGELRKTLETINGFDAGRADRVAMDQSNKINAFIQRENAKSLGITQGIWVHHPGRYTSRKSHLQMNGKTFDLDKGMWDPTVGDYVQPCQLPYCRCSFRMILPKEMQ